MQIAFSGDQLYEMSESIFFEKKKKNINSFILLNLPIQW